MELTSAPHNAAAWALKPKTRPLVVSSAPYKSPPPGFVTIKVHSVAVNPIDWINQDQDVFKAQYPTIFGLDIAGTVEEIGEGVRLLQVGRRIIAQAGASSSNDSSRGAFQKYVVVSQNAVAELPKEIAFERGVVLPLGISTAAAGLYQKDFLSLPFPSIEGLPGILNHTRTLVVWGGSSSVGSCAIQMANASGAEIFTVASRKNFYYVKSLGATKVFDYHDDDVEDQIVEALKTKTLAGVYHAAGADGAVQTCARIADRSTGKALVVTVKGVPDAGIPCTVRVKAISSSSIFKGGNQIGPDIWRKYLPSALARGTLVPKPDPLIVGNGLRSVQLGLDKQKAGVSARKVVVNKIDDDSSHELVELSTFTPS
ncbi:GroES-like protein [Paraphaeosphaeria sporulosa]|uniref:GroES-like protein n=1 Tax=Paraphaeosphaeria sporulosa TaxID=1460663 RepID=A0A177C5N9_9PLEO|nr:GroES-like protein [Paraphaeosphaeria sporulosa]OAG02202.1 GroES-like protein [Paraphaeosphaeria sporulosa]